MVAAGRHGRAGPARKRLTKRRLTNIAAYYLQRHASSVANFRQVLRRRVRRELVPGADPVEANGWIDEIVADFVARRLLNDQTYAAARVVRDRMLAKAPRKTRAALLAKGVGSTIVNDAVRDDGSAEWSAALAVARRRRLGPYSVKPRDPDTDRRDLGVLGRAGIGFAVAKKVMALSEPP